MHNQRCQYNDTDGLTVRPSVNGYLLRFHTTEGCFTYLSPDQVKQVLAYCQKWLDSLPADLDQPE